MEQDDAIFQFRMLSTDVRNRPSTSVLENGTQKGTQTTFRSLLEAFFATKSLLRTGGRRGSRTPGLMRVMHAL
jgi:hypothetical protein